MTALLAILLLLIVLWATRKRSISLRATTPLLSRMRQRWPVNREISPRTIDGFAAQRAVCLSDATCRYATQQSVLTNFPNRPCTTFKVDRHSGDGLWLAPSSSEYTVMHEKYCIFCSADFLRSPPENSCRTRAKRGVEHKIQTAS